MKRLITLLILFALLVLALSALVACDNSLPQPPSKEDITLINGQFYVNGQATNVTLDNAVTINFVQSAQSNKGTLKIDTKYYDFFDKVTYSIERIATAKLPNDKPDIVLTDISASNITVDKQDYSADIQLAYHGDWTIYVTLQYDNGQMHTVQHNITVTANEYHIIYSGATMPVLLNVADMLAGNWGGVTYLCAERSNMFNWNELPDNVYPAPTSTTKQSVTNLGLFDDNGNQKTTTYGELINGSWGKILLDDNNIYFMKQWIAELYALDNTAIFHFYAMDSRLSPALLMSYANYLPEEQFDITIYPDGSGTGNSISAEKMFTITDYTIRRNSVIKQLQNNFTSIGAAINVPYYYSYVLGIEQDNVTYVMHCKDAVLAQVTDSQLRDLIDSNIVSMTVQDALNNIQQANQMDTFEYLLRLKWVDNLGEIGTAKQYFTNPNGKPSLMILGAAPQTEGLNNVGTDFLSLMQYVVDNYSQQYNILYKGHPAYPLNSYDNATVRQAFFEQYGITILPNATPAETFMYLYENVYIGGYFSTTFASSQIGQTLFFFGTEADIKAQPSISFMFDETADGYLGIFESSKFLNKDTIETN